MQVHKNMERRQLTFKHSLKRKTSRRQKKFTVTWPARRTHRTCSLSSMLSPMWSSRTTWGAVACTKGNYCAACPRIPCAATLIISSTAIPSQDVWFQCDKLQTKPRNSFWKWTSPAGGNISISIFQDNSRLQLQPKWFSFRRILKLEKQSLSLIWKTENYCLLHFHTKIGDWFEISIFWNSKIVFLHFETSHKILWIIENFHTSVSFEKMPGK